ncbi:MAG: hypothetical protein LUO89_09875 [Methanothrix sp.]|nr:hypothetical protein [Methanothrix sp.]
MAQKKRARVHFFPYRKVGVFVTLRAPDVINLKINEGILDIMNFKTVKSLESSLGQRDKIELHTSRRIASRIILLLLLSLPLLVFSALAYDFVGTVEKVSEPNGMTVNVTQPGTYGLQADVEVLLDKPLADLVFFKGKELQFEILGHDILDRPVCEAYLDGTNIRHVSYCRLNPVDCSYSSYCRNSPACELTGGYLYIPCYGQCRSFYPYFWLPLP